ncbi:MAG: ATP-binding cassette domain-containing protein [Rhizobiales bacterium]|nr:ATP-binding cassette domain-containing protein [Hyphomicrobiales bacterium]
MLHVDDLHTYLGDSYVIQGVSLAVPSGKVVALLGRNGAGKTTTLRSIMRMVHPRRGRVTFDGRDISALATFEIARSRISFVQETRAIFPSLSVEENIAVAARPAENGNGWTMQRIFDDFPNLAARRRNGGSQLSGGEQQMLAIARALVANPRLMLLDEPSEGLAPLIVRQIADIIGNLKRAGMTMLLVEQNFVLATEVADHIVVLGKGRVRWTGTSEELRKSDEIRHTWLGV